MWRSHCTEASQSIHAGNWVLAAPIPSRTLADERVRRHFPGRKVFTIEQLAELNVSVSPGQTLLLSRKLPSGKAERLVPCLEPIGSLFGTALTIAQDMGAGQEHLADAFVQGQRAPGERVVHGATEQ